jgi:hypothetical protein
MRAHLDNRCCNEPFDYAKWRENLFKNVPLDEFLNKAAAFHKAQKEKQ